MKRFALFLALIAFGFACMDTTSPDRHGLKLENPTVSKVLGEKPPPPVDAVIIVSVESPGTASIQSLATAVFTGVYFSNGILTEDGDPIPTFDGTAWLRLDNKQPDIAGFLSASVTANARFMARDMNFSGHGTLFIGDHAYTITAVDLFIPEPRCGAPEEGLPSPCATIEFRAVDENGAEATGQAAAFDKATCLEETKKGDLVFVCDFRGR